MNRRAWVSVHGMFCATLTLGVVLGCGETEVEPPDTPPTDTEPVWVMPYSPCDEEGWSCGGVEVSAIEAGREMDSAADRLRALDLTPPEFAQGLRDDGFNAYSTQDGRIMYWVPGGLPRVWDTNRPVMHHPTDAMTPEEFWLDGVFPDDMSRRNGLSVSSPERKGWERRDKKALVLSSFYSADDPASSSRIWKVETDEVVTWLNSMEEYTGRVDTFFDAQVRVRTIQNLRDYDFVYVSSHGSQEYESRLGRTISVFTMGFPLMKVGYDKTKTYTKAEYEAFSNVGCDAVEELLDASLPIYKEKGITPERYRGMVCSYSNNYWTTSDQGPAKIGAYYMGVTGEYLAQPQWNSAPFDNSILWLSACSLAKTFSQSGFDLFAKTGTSIVGFTADVTVSFAKGRFAAYSERMSKGYEDIRYIFDRQNEATIVDPYKGAQLDVMYTSGEAARVREVARLASDGSVFETASPPLTPRRNGEVYDTLELELGMLGVRADHPDGGLKDHQVGLFLADELGQPIGEVLSPGFMGLDDSTAKELDPERGLMIVPVDVVFPFDLAGLEVVDVVAVARGPEGGTSERTYSLRIRDPNCPHAQLSIGEDAALESNEVMFGSQIPGLYTVGFSRVEIDDQGNQSEDVHGSGQLFFQGTPTESTSWAIAPLVSGSVSTGRVTLSFDTTDSDAPDPVTVSLRRVEGTSRLQGDISGSGRAVEGSTDRGYLPFRLTFTTDDKDRMEPRTACYFYSEP